MTKMLGQEDIPNRTFTVESRLGMARFALQTIVRNIGGRGRHSRATPEELARITTLKAHIRELREML